jgi:hypothetical protein
VAFGSVVIGMVRIIRGVRFPEKFTVSFETLQLLTVASNRAMNFAVSEFPDPFIRRDNDCELGWFHKGCLALVSGLVENLPDSAMDVGREKLQSISKIVDFRMLLGGIERLLGMTICSESNHFAIILHNIGVLIRFLDSFFQTLTTLRMDDLRSPRRRTGNTEKRH